MYQGESRLLDPTRNLCNLPLLHEEYSWNREVADLRLVLWRGLLAHFQTILCDNLVSKEKLVVCQTVYSDSSSKLVLCGLFCVLSAATDNRVTRYAFTIQKKHESTAAMGISS